MEKRICDMCDSLLIGDEGFAFYSSLKVVIPDVGALGAGLNCELGALICCTRCTERLLTDERIRKEEAVVHLVDSIEDIERIIAHGRNAGIAERCRALGLNAETAKVAARELALAYFEDKEGVTGASAAIGPLIESAPSKVKKW